MILSHTGILGEKIEVNIDKNTELRLKELFASGQLTHQDFVTLLSFMARHPDVGKQIAKNTGSHIPLLAVIDVLLKIRAIEANETIIELGTVFPDHETICGGNCYLEASAGNFVPLRDRLLTGQATTTFDRAALAVIFTGSPRSIDAILPNLLPRGNRARAAMLGRVFGVTALSPAALSRALASKRQPRQRTGSWKTVYGRRKAAKEYARLRQRMSKTGSYDLVAGMGFYRFRPSEKTIEAAVTESHRRTGGVRSKAEIQAALKIYLDYRALGNPQNS